MIGPTALLLGNRFDIVMKAMYAMYSFKGTAVPSFVTRAYLRHIYVWNKYQERCHDFTGDEDWVDKGKPCTPKTTAEDFINSFDGLLRGIERDGFDIVKSMVPVSKELFPLNGAHRVAAALGLGLSAMPIQVTDDTGVYPWTEQFFQSEGLEEKYSDFAMLSLALNEKKATVITFWPEAAGNKEKMESVKPLVETYCTDSNVLYRKTILLTKKGLESMVEHAYGRQGWLGGKVSQLSSTYKNSEEERAVTLWFLFEKEGKMVACKEKLREHFNLSQIKSSVHIPDFHEEAILMAEMSLNPNSVHYMNNRVGSSCQEISEELALRRGVEPINPSSFVHEQGIMFDSGGVMSIFGLRPRTDIDILFQGEVDSRYLGDARGIHIEDHAFINNLLSGRGRAWGQEHLSADPKKSAADFFTDPEYYGYCHGLKFVSLPQLVKYKQARGEKNKDDKDVKQMQEFLAKHPLK
jgi:hypothetical protein